MKGLMVVMLSGVLVAGSVGLVAGTEKSVKGPAPKLITLDAKGKDYLPILTGAPETVTMRSGLVILAPGKDVGKHSTKDNEELVIVLEGRGEMRITGGETIPVSAGQAVYCPPRREHDMVNTGTSVLRYIYVVAGAR